GLCCRVQAVEAASCSDRARDRPPEECAWCWAARPPAVAAACEERGASRTRAPPLSCPPPCLRRFLARVGLSPGLEPGRDAASAFQRAICIVWHLASVKIGTSSKKDLLVLVLSFCLFPTWQPPAAHKC
ncbi:hypothetical protein LEMLEM_LOCUS8306, partial [Lemmus lemmus]